MDNVKQNDWIAINLLNQDVSFEKLVSDGVTSLNTGIRPREDYLELDSIKKAFSDDSGKFNEAKFNEFYTNALMQYVAFSDIDQEKWLKDTFTYDALDINRRKENDIKSDPVYEIRKVANPFETSYYFHEGKEGPRSLSIAELAQKNKYYDRATGKWSDKSPNELGVIGTLFEKPLVLATYDEDEFDEFGRKIHSKGDPKVNEDGKFYYETLDGREIYGKQALTALDVLTTDGSGWNKIDIFDTDSIEISPFKSVTRTLALTAPFLISGIGPWWAGITASVYFTDALPSLAKTLGGLLNPNYTPSKGLNNFEGFMKKFDMSPSEYSQMHTWSFDNICQFVQTSAAQLFQQKWVASIPKLLGMDKRTLAAVGEVQNSLIEKAVEKGLINRGELIQAVKAGQWSGRIGTIIESMPEYKKAFDIYQRATNVSTAIARAYLVTTAASQTYGDAIQNGFDRLTASLISAGVYAGFFTLFKFDYLKHYLMTGMDLEESAQALRQLTYGYLQGRGKTEFGKAAAQGGSIGVFNKAVQKINSLWTEVMYGGRRNIATSALSEAYEEVTEELMTDFANVALGNGLNALKEQMGYKSQGHFDYAQSNPLQRYLVSFVGGGIGGSIFGLDNWIRTKQHSAEWSKLMSSQPEMARGIIKAISSGKASDLKKIAESLRGKSMGSTTLSYYERDENGNFVPAKNKNETQNAYLIDSFISYVDMMDQFLTQEGIKYSKDDIANIPIYRGLTAYEIAKEGNDKLLDVIHDDLTRSQTRLGEIYSELYKLGKDEKSDKTEIALLQSEMDVIKNKIQKIMSGGDEFYFGKILADLTPSVFGTNYSPNVESYAKSVFGYDYQTLTPTLKAAIDEKYKKYEESGAKDLDNTIAFQMHRKMSEEIASNLLAKESGLERTTVNLSRSLEYDAVNDIFTFKDDHDGSIAYSDILAEVRNALQNTSFRNDIKLAKSIANYFYSFKFGGDTLISNKLGLADLYWFDIDSLHTIDENGDPLYESIVDENGQIVYEQTPDSQEAKRLVVPFNIDVENDLDYIKWNKLINYISEKLINFIEDSKQYALDNEQLKSFDKWVEIIKNASGSDDTDNNVFSKANWMHYGLGDIDEIDDLLSTLGLTSPKIIEEEIIKAQSAPQTYIMNSANKDNLEKFKVQLKQLISVLNGAQSVTRSVNQLTSVNEVINEFNKIHDNKDVKELPVISPKLHNLLATTIGSFEAKIDGLIKLSNRNANNENLREQRLGLLVKQDRQKVYKTLTDVLQPTLDQSNLPPLPEFDFDQPVDIETLDQDAIEAEDVKVEQQLVNNEIKIHKYFNSLNKDQKVVFIEKLIEIFPKFDLEPAYLSLNISQNTDEYHSEDSLNFWYLAGNLICDPVKFYKNYKQTILNGEFEKAPYYSQEFVVRQAIQFLNGNRSDIELIIETIQNKENVNIKSVYATLTGVFRFAAASGVGKSVAVIPLIKLVQDKIKPSQYIYSAPTNDNLAKLDSPDSSKYTIEKLFKLFEEEISIIKKDTSEEVKYNLNDFKNYIKLNQNRTEFNSDEYDLVLSENLKALLGKVSADSNIPTILFIDEGTYVSREQYILLNEITKQINFYVIPTGDILQSGYFNANQESDNFDKCLTFIGSSLYESKRVTTNVSKWNNSQLAKFVYNTDNQIVELQFGEGDSDIAGIKQNNSVLTQEELDNFVASHPNASILLYNTTRQQLRIPDNVTVRDTVKAIQGQEFDYVLVNGNIEYSDGVQNLSSRKDLYTILTRGKRATVIYGKIVNKRANLKNVNYRTSFTETQKDWKDVVDISLNEESIKMYQEYRKRTLEKLQLPDEQTDDSQTENVVNSDDGNQIEDTTTSTENSEPEVNNESKIEEPDPQPNLLQPESNIPSQITNEDLNNSTKQLTEGDIPIINSVLRMHTFYNRFGGKINEEEVYERGNENEDLNIFLERNAPIRSEEFRKAALLFNVVKNNLYRKLAGESYKLQGIDDEGEFLIKVSHYNEDIDATWGKGNFDEELDKSKSGVFRRLIYKVGDQEITLAIFPNENSLRADGDLKLLEKINKLWPKQGNPVYYRFNSEKIKFFTPDNPIFFDKLKPFENSRHWKQYAYTNGIPDYEYSFFQTSLPFRMNYDAITQPRYNEESIKGLCDEIDALYREVAKLWDSKFSTDENNPFKQRPNEEGKQEVKKITRINPSTPTVLCRLKLDYNVNAKSDINNDLLLYVADLRNTRKMLKECLEELRKPIDDLTKERISRKARIRTTVQPLQLVYNYKPTAEWEERFKNDVRLIGSKASYNKLSVNIKSWIIRLKALKNIAASENLPLWINEISKDSLETIDDLLNNVIRHTKNGKILQRNDIGEVFEDDNLVNTIWNIYKNIYSDLSEFKNLCKSFNLNEENIGTDFELNSNIFANYEVSNYDKTYAINRIPENIPYEADGKNVYERGWTLLSYLDNEEGLESVFTEITDVVEEFLDSVQSTDLKSESTLDEYNQKEEESVKPFIVNISWANDSKDIPDIEFVWKDGKKYLLRFNRIVESKGDTWLLFEYNDTWGYYYGVNSDNEILDNIDEIVSEIVPSDILEYIRSGQLNQDLEEDLINTLTPNYIPLVERFFKDKFNVDYRYDYSTSEDSSSTETDVNPQIEVEIDEETKQDLLTEDAQDIVDTIDDGGLLKTFVEYMVTSQGYFITEDEANSTDTESISVKIGRKNNTYTFEKNFALKLQEYMDSKLNIYNVPSNKNYLLKKTKDLLDTLIAGEYC